MINSNVIKHMSSTFLCLFLLLCSLGTLKVYISPEVYWAISIFFWGSYLFYSRKNTTTSWSMIFYNMYPWLIGWLFLILGILISDLLNHQANISSIIKYIIILIMCLMSLRYIDGSILEFKVALYISLAINTAVLFLLILKFNELLIILGDGRTGWFANWPGKLWYVGAFIYPVALLDTLFSSQKKSWVYVFCSLLLIAIDGSRTGLLWIILVSIILIGGGILCKKTRFIHKPIILSFFIYLIFAIIQPSLLDKLQNRDSSNSSHELSKSSISRITTGDNQTRLTMIKTAAHASIDNLPFGSGFGTTKSQESDGSYSVIHFAYLQVLADLGLFGFLGLILIIYYPIYRAVKYIFFNPGNTCRKIKEIALPLSIILLFALTHYLHPISNELTEWGVVIIATIILLKKTMTPNEKITAE